MNSSTSSRPFSSAARSYQGFQAIINPFIASSGNYTGHACDPDTDKDKEKSPTMWG
jgi:hypothetical protein